MFSRGMVNAVLGTRLTDSVPKSKQDEKCDSMVPLSRTKRREMLIRQGHLFLP